MEKFVHIRRKYLSGLSEERIAELWRMYEKLNPEYYRDRLNLVPGVNGDDEDYRRLTNPVLAFAFNGASGIDNNEILPGSVYGDMEEFWFRYLYPVTSEGKSDA